ncbi:MAG: phage terminase large subunit family protein [Actinobacteria bacterium]|nr:phage terminase large subunit family protein [Actinomycetota bacterium]
MSVDRPSLREILRDEKARKHAEDTGTLLSLQEWSYRVPEPKGPVQFKDFPLMEELYGPELDNVEAAVVKKSTQVGVSTLMWRWAARRAETFGETVIYFFPTDTHVREFGDRRIEPSIQASELLQRRIPAHYVRHKGLKRIGSGFLSLRGLSSRIATQEVDAEAIVMDEYDEANPALVAQAERRISGAKQLGRTPRIRRVGIPTLPGYGIDAEFERSDKRRWLVTCPECGDEQPLSFDENLRWTVPGMDGVMRAGHDDYDDARDVETAYRVCRSCEASLEPAPENPGPLATGRWVADAPGRSLVGYHVQRLAIPRTDLPQLVIASRKTAPVDVEAFYNNDLGLSFTSAEAALTDEDLDRAQALGGEAITGYRGRFITTMGVDVATSRDMNVRISELPPDGPRRAVYIGTAADYSEVRDLMERFKVSMAVVDSMPERRAIAQPLAADFPGRVVMARYDEEVEKGESPGAQQDVPLKYDREKNMVTVSRTDALDSMFDGIRNGRNAPLAIPPRGYREQMKAPKRRTVRDGRGRPRRVYVKTGSAGDDYAHAEVYDLVAKEMYALFMEAGYLERAARGEVLDPAARYAEDPEPLAAPAEY